MSIRASLNHAFRADFAEHLPLTALEMDRLRDGPRRDRWALADLLSVFAFARPRRGVCWSRPELEDFRALVMRQPPV
jgi:hypothetical protein